jgi:hypothetical protein
LAEYLLLAYLPPEHAVVDTKLAAVFINELYPVKFAVPARPLLRPRAQAKEDLTENVQDAI